MTGYKFAPEAPRGKLHVELEKKLRTSGTAILDTDMFTIGLSQMFIFDTLGLAMQFLGWVSGAGGDSRMMLPLLMLSNST